jgi:hypothetical protein
MISEDEVKGRVEVFFQVLPIGDLFTSSRLENQKKSLWEMLRKCGVTLKNSDFMILDHSRIGNYTITIARYTLDYVDDRDTTGKNVCVEGSVAMKTDEFDNRDIRISLKTDPFGHNPDTVQSQSSWIRDNI